MYMQTAYVLHIIYYIFNIDDLCAPSRIRCVHTLILPALLCFYMIINNHVITRSLIIVFILTSRNFASDNVGNLACLNSLVCDSRCTMD